MTRSSGVYAPLAPTTADSADTADGVISAAPHSEQELPRRRWLLSALLSGALTVNSRTADSGQDFDSLSAPSSMAVSARQEPADSGFPTGYAPHLERLADVQSRVSGVSAVSAAVRQVGLAYPAYTTIADRASLDAALPDLLAAPMLALDTETTGLDPQCDRLRLFQLATHKRVYIVDSFRLDPRLLSQVLRHCPTLVAHNARFDAAFLRSLGLQCDRWFDTMLASQVLWAGDRTIRHSLADVAERVLGVTLDKSARRSDWSGDLTADQLAYAAKDASILLPLARALKAKLDSAGLMRTADLEMLALPAIGWMQQTGVGFDSEAWRTLSDRALVERLTLGRELDTLTLDQLGRNTLFGRATHVNWNAPQQVLAALRALGIDATDTNEQTLQALVGAHPAVSVLLRHRDAAKREGTYGLDFLANVHPRTGRIHADWKQLGASSGRMACRAPNLQNVPRTPAYRACFRAPDGRVLIKADYSQIELRIAAELADERRMLEAYRNGEDLHTLTARLVLGQEPTKEARQAAKALNFGLLYGMGAEGLMRQAATQYGVQWTLNQATGFRDAFFSAYPGLRAWHRGIGGANETRTVCGRRRLLHGTDARFTNRVNTPVQRTGADGMKAALALLWQRRDRCPDAFPVLAEHDEIVMEAPADQAEQVVAHLEACMRDGMAEFLERVPIVVETRIAPTWAG